MKDQAKKKKDLGISLFLSVIKPHYIPDSGSVGSLNSHTNESTNVGHALIQFISQHSGSSKNLPFNF